MVIPGEVVRGKSTLLGTPGALSLSGFGVEFSARTLELPWMNNERGRSCTAPGVDHGRVWFSPHLNRLVIRYDDRNGRQDCLVHNGNWAGEGAGEITQIHGCTEVGSGYGNVRRPDGKTQWGIVASKPTLDALIAALEIPGVAHITDAQGYVSGYHDVAVTYRWAEGCEPAEDYATDDAVPEVA